MFCPASWNLRRCTEETAVRKLFHPMMEGVFSTVAKIAAGSPVLPQCGEVASQAPDSQLNWILSRVRTAEFERLLNQHPMMALARENSIEVDYDALAQHYGIPTFWLDITSNIDIACFFAVARFDKEGVISPCEEGTGMIYRVHWRSFEDPLRFFTS